MKHVVIDGSNIATEGRDAPSLAQLDEAVRAFIDEYAPDLVTVVVDATFPNRIDPKERQTFEDAVDANELITPPAGAIGRGDAFVLQIARKADANILSNDSFQEFHGDYPWLFERGRLIGGKPVPHVGWVFMERTPVRGPTSRRSVSDARKVVSKATKATKATKTTRSTKAAKAAAADLGAGADGDRLPDADAVEAAAPTAKRRRSRAAKAAPEATAAAAAVPADRTGPELVGVAEAGSAGPASDGDGRSDGRAPARPSKGVAPYNEALPFIEFIADHPVGSEVEATVERFSSHGAYVMSGAARGYVPLRNLGDPAPRSAKELLQVGESRRFVVVAIDPPRRGIDLALPGVVTPAPAPSSITVDDLAVEPDREAGGAADGESTDPASRKATAKRTTARKASTRSTGKKTPAKKAAAKKAAAKTSASATRKASTAKAPAAKAPAAKAPAARVPAAKTPAAKKAARKTAAKKGSGTKAATKATKRSSAKPARKASAGQ